MLLVVVILLLIVPLPHRMRTMTEIAAGTSPHWCEASITICKLYDVDYKRQEVVLYLDLLAFLVFRRIFSSAVECILQLNPVSS